MIEVTRLDIYHSFRPARRAKTFVNLSEVSTITELYDPEKWGEPVCEFHMKNGGKFVVAGRPEDFVDGE